MPLTHTLNNAEKTLNITISGAFNFDLHLEFRDSYQKVAPESVSTVNVNLSRADYMDSAALGMLLLLEDHFEDADIKLEDCSKYIKDVLSVANFDQKFSIS